MSNLLGKKSPTYCSKKIHMVKIELPALLIHDGCCKVSPVKIHEQSLLDDDLERSLNTESMIRDRAIMLEGGQNPSCNHCWFDENISGHSRRTSSSEIDDLLQFPEVTTAEKDQIMRTELVLSNVCTLNCMYCSPRNSSKIAEDHSRHGPYPHMFSMSAFQEKPRIAKSMVELETKVTDSLLKRLKNQKVITLSGGEPTLSKNFWRILEECALEGGENRLFSVNTNGMLDDEKREELVTLLNEMTSKNWTVEITLSVDSHGKQAEYIRHGLDYDRLFTLFDTLAEKCPSVRISTGITTTALIYEGIDKLLIDILKRAKVFDHKLIHFNTLLDPGFLAMSNLPISMRKELVARVDEVFDFYVPDSKLKTVVPSWLFLKERLVVPSVYQPIYSSRLKEYFDERDRRLGTDQSIFESFLKTLKEHELKGTQHV